MPDDTPAEATFADVMDNFGLSLSDLERRRREPAPTEPATKPVSVTELGVGQILVRSSYEHGPATVTSLDTGELYGSPTVIVDADEGGCWRRWIYYASEMVEVAE